MTPLAVGQVLGDRFELLGELGRGGMATVWLAQDRTRGERVAVKILHPHLANDVSARARLRRELQAAGLVRHESVLAPWDLLELDGHVALSMPYHRGATLGETVARVGPLPVETVRAVGLQLAAALTAAHRLGVLHRDISANNVMLDESGRAALMDFGLARVQAAHTTRHSAALGTAGHTAPEVYDGVRGDARSDLYAVGTLLFLAATGRAPFGEGAAGGILKRQLAGEHPHVRELRPDLPEDLARTIEALLAVDPAQRPQSAAELGELLSARAAPEPPPHKVGPPPAADPRALTRRPELPEGRYTVEVRARKGRPRPKRTQPGPGARYAVQLGNEVLRRLSLPDLPPEWTQLQDAALTPEQLLTRAVALAGGLPPDALRPGPVIQERTFRLVAGVSEACADNLAALADSQGYEARSYEVKPRPQGPERLLAYAPLLIPVVWLSFATLLSWNMDPMLVLPVAVLLTLILPVVGREFGGARKGDKLPLAFARDLSAHLGPGFALPAASSGPPAAAAAEPSPPVTPPSRAQEALALAQARIQRLRAALEAAELPAAVGRDLRARASELEAQARALAAHAERLTAALATAPDPGAGAELGRLEERLRRLEALAQAGEPVSPGERESLERTLHALREEQRAHEAQESQLTAALARLAELGAAALAAARRLRATGSPDPTPPAQAALERLGQDLDTLEQARRELDEHQLRRAQAASQLRARQ